MNKKQSKQTPKITKENLFYYKIILIGAIVLLISFCWYAPAKLTIFNLSGPSMTPTFKDGEQALISRSSYQKTQLHHGQFIVLTEIPNGKDKMLKRIIGLPGDHLIIESGKITRNGKVIEEPYLNEPNWFISIPFNQVLGENEVYVMGDNRNHSIDSRTLGPIDLTTQYIGVVIKKINQPQLKEAVNEKQ